MTEKQLKLWQTQGIICSAGAEDIRNACGVEPMQRGRILRPLMSLIACLLLLAAASIFINENWGQIADICKQIGAALLLLLCWLGFAIARWRKAVWISELFALAGCGMWILNLMLQTYLFNMTPPAVDGLPLVIAGVLLLPLIFPLRLCFVLLVCLSTFWVTLLYTTPSDESVLGLLPAESNTSDMKAWGYLVAGLALLFWAAVSQIFGQSKGEYRHYGLISPLCWVLSLLCFFLLADCRFRGYDTYQSMITPIYYLPCILLGLFAWASMGRGISKTGQCCLFLLSFAPSLSLAYYLEGYDDIRILYAALACFSLTAMGYALATRSALWLCGSIVLVFTSFVFLMSFNRSIADLDKAPLLGFFGLLTALIAYASLRRAGKLHVEGAAQ